MTVDFRAAWCATDLGEHRPCRRTYEWYPYASLPPLDASRFTGEFGWLGDPGGTVPAWAEQLRESDRRLAGEGLSLPGDFVTFHTSSNLLGTLDGVSVTSCWTSLSEPLPSPAEPGAFLVRFLRDQQDCVLWYLYLRPSGETFVVSSSLDYEYEYQARDADDQPESDLDDPVAQAAEIHWCAPSFEHFAYRFWLENRLWRALHGGNAGPPLDTGMREYLSHYQSAAALRGT